MKRMFNFGVAFMLTGALLAGGPSLGLAQEAQDQANPPQQTTPRADATEKESARAEVVKIENNVLTVTLEGKRHSLRLGENAKVVVEGTETSIDDVKAGDFVEVRVGNDEQVFLVLRGQSEQRQRTSRRIGLDERQPKNAIRASKLMGMDVKNARGEDLGDIEDVVLDTHAGDVRYVVLSFGGFLDIGDKLFAVPWESMTIAHEKDDPDSRFLMFDVTKERLESMPGFDKDKWPAMADGYWGDVNTFHHNKVDKDLDVDKEQDIRKPIDKREQD